MIDTNKNLELSAIKEKLDLTNGNILENQSLMIDGSICDEFPNKDNMKAGKGEIEENLKPFSQIGYLPNIFQKMETKKRVEDYEEPNNPQKLSQYYALENVKKEYTYEFEEFYNTDKSQSIDPTLEAIESNRKIIRNNEGVEELVLAKSSNKEDMLALKEIASIHYKRNMIRYIPIDINNCLNLSELRLDYNLISDIPLYISKLTSLKILTLSHNLITQIPQELPKLKNLKTLILDNNKISILAKPLCEMTGLETLYLHGNEIERLSTQFYHLENLVKLSFDWIAYINYGGCAILKGFKKREIINRIRNICKENHQEYLTFVLFFTQYLNLDHKNIYETTFFRNRNVLHHACQLGNLAVVKAIIEGDQNSCININQPDLSQFTPLLISIKAGNFKISEFLLDSQKCDINFGSERLNFPLLEAIIKKEYRLVDKMLSIPNINLEITDFEKNNAIHLLLMNFSCESRDIENIITKILKTTNIQNFYNRIKLTPLHLAVKKNHKAALNFVINYNKTHSESKRFQVDKVCGKFGWNILHYAVVFSHLELLRLILSTEVNLFERDVNGKTPKDLAIVNSTNKKLIIHAEKNYFIKIKNEFPKTNSAFETMERQLNPSFFVDLKYNSKLPIKFLNMAKSKENKFSDQIDFKNRDKFKPTWTIGPTGPTGGTIPIIPLSIRHFKYKCEKSNSEMKHLFGRHGSNSTYYHIKKQANYIIYKNSVNQSVNQKNSRGLKVKNKNDSISTILEFSNISSEKKILKINPSITKKMDEIPLTLRQTIKINNILSINTCKSNNFRGTSTSLFSSYNLEHDKLKCYYQLLDLKGSIYLKIRLLYHILFTNYSLNLLNELFKNMKNKTLKHYTHGFIFLKHHLDEIYEKPAHFEINHCSLSRIKYFSPTNFAFHNISNNLTQKHKNGNRKIEAIQMKNIIEEFTTNKTNHYFANK